MTKKGGRLVGFRALVTGASAGIGEAIAEAFALEGAHVLVHGRDAGRTAAVAARLGGTPLVADLSDPGQTEDLAADASRDGLDVLVNNAGVEFAARLEDLDAGRMRALLEVNLVAPALLMRRALPTLRDSGRGSVINVTSIHETVPVAGNGAYASSKAALAMLTRTAAVEWGPSGVRVNALAPGAIRTAMNADLLDAIKPEVFADWIPAGRVGTTSDVVGAAVFLASAESGYVTGTTLTVDGGYQNNLVRYPDGIGH